MKRYVSLGAGVQSTTLVLMAAHGEFDDMPDAAIFSDTGDESQAVYRHLAWLRSPNVLPFPVYVINAGRRLSDDIRAAAEHSDQRFVSVPFFSKTVVAVNGAAGTKIGEFAEKGQGRRQCTREFKLDPISKTIRQLMGYKPRQRIPHGLVESWIGISTDEIIRMKPSREKWITNRHPLIEKDMSRRDCLRWLASNDYPTPPKSACVFCPYRSNAGWRQLRDHEPEAFEEAVRIDRLIRTNGTMKGMVSPQYVHPSLVPLDEADLESSDERQADMFGNECEGICGV